MNSSFLELPRLLAHGLPLPPDRGVRQQRDQGSPRPPDRGVRQQRDQGSPRRGVIITVFRFWEGSTRTLLKLSKTPHNSIYQECPAAPAPAPPPTHRPTPRPPRPPRRPRPSIQSSNSLCRREFPRTSVGRTRQARCVFAVERTGV